MGNSEFLQKLRDYLIRNFREIEHPAEPFDVSRRFTLEEVESTTAALLELLRLSTTIADAQDLEKQVLFSFREYLSAPPLETERRVSAAGHLAERLEPFLKKLFVLRHPSALMPDSLGRLLKEKDVVGYQGELLHKPTDEQMLAALRSQRTPEAILHDAYYFRNNWAHKAKLLAPVEEQRYWRSVVAAYLLIAEKNIDLVDNVKSCRERDAQIRSGLRVCLGNMRGRFDDTRWRNEYYIPLTVEQGGKLDDHVRVFLASQTERLLVVTGRTGAGKSTFLERVTADLADQALNVFDSEAFEYLTVPVHLELKRYVPGKRQYLLKKLYKEFDPNRLLGVTGRRVNSWPQTLSPIALVACLDGLDEVPSTAYPMVVSEIEDLVADFENVKVIVTSRPNAVPPHWRNSVVHIAPLTREEVFAYFGHPERLALLASDVQAFLEGKPDLVDILQDPLMAEAACRYWRRFEPADPADGLDPRVRQEALLEGPLLHYLYECFFTHHLRRAFRGQVMDIERAEQMNALASLALEMDDDPFANLELITEVFEKFERGTAAREKLLNVFVDTGLLKSRDTEFAFRNDTVKAYFAAVGLHSRMGKRKDVEQALSLIRQVNDFWHRCVGLLKQIYPLNDFSHIEKHLASLAEA